jgi:hypothetical protein
MDITTFFALLLLIALYLILRLSEQKPDKQYQLLINRTGKRLAKQLVKDTKRKYPLRSQQWVYKKVLADLDKGKI